MATREEIEAAYQMLQTRPGDPAFQRMYKQISSEPATSQTVIIGEQPVVPEFKQRETRSGTRPSGYVKALID